MMKSTAASLAVAVAATESEHIHSTFPSWEEAVAEPFASIRLDPHYKHHHKQQHHNNHLQNNFAKLLNETNAEAHAQTNLDHASVFAGGVGVGPLRIPVERDIKLAKRDEGTPRVAEGRPKLWSKLQRKGEPKGPQKVPLRNFLDVMYTATVYVGKDSGKLTPISDLVMDTGSDAGWMFRKKSTGCCPAGYCSPEKQTIEFCHKPETCLAKGIPNKNENNFGKENDPFTICYGKGFIGGVMTSSYVALGSPDTVIPFNVGAGDTASSMANDFKNTNGVFGLGPLNEKNSEPLILKLHQNNPLAVPEPMFSFDLTAGQSQLWVGGIDPALTKDGDFINWAGTNPSEHMKYWWVVKGHTSYSLNDGTIGTPHEGNVIMDSGTTDFMLTPPMYRDLKREVANYFNMTYDHPFFMGYAEKCSAKVFQRDWSKAPKINMYISGKEGTFNYPIGAESYIMKVTLKGYKFCLFGASELGDMDGNLMIAGDTWMRSWYTAYKYGKNSHREVGIITPKDAKSGPIPEAWSPHPAADAQKEASANHAHSASDILGGDRAAFSTNEKDETRKKAGGRKKAVRAHPHDAHKKP